ncbi:hypothetical protein LguiB_022527 [Lonicera macranthoides]
MDGNGSMNFRTWELYEPTTTFRSHLGLELMSTASEKPVLSGGNHQPVMATPNGGPFHHHRACGVSDSFFPIDVRDAWVHHTRGRYFNALPGSHHPNFTFLQETSGANHVQMIQPPNSLKEGMVAQIEEPEPELDLEPEPELELDRGGPLKKRSAVKPHKSPKTKKAKRAPRAPRDESNHSVQRARAPKRSTEVIINGIDMDISGIPIPVCSCTGVSQQCYRWGSGGWQSACCTTDMSVYPLPMSTKRRGARIAGRKMSLGAFKKVLEKLASEGYNFSNPIDLKTHWAKHGTNKFVTIK